MSTHTNILIFGVTNMEPSVVTLEASCGCECRRALWTIIVTFPDVLLDVETCNVLCCLQLIHENDNWSCLLNAEKQSYLWTEEIYNLAKFLALSQQFFRSDGQRWTLCMSSLSSSSRDFLLCLSFSLWQYFFWWCFWVFTWCRVPGQQVCPANTCWPGMACRPKPQQHLLSRHALGGVPGQQVPCSKQ